MAGEFDPPKLSLGEPVVIQAGVQPKYDPQLAWQADWQYWTNSSYPASVWKQAYQSQTVAGSAAAARELRQEFDREFQKLNAGGKGYLTEDELKNDPQLALLAQHTRVLEQLWDNPGNSSDPAPPGVTKMEMEALELLQARNGPQALAKFKIEEARSQWAEGGGIAGALVGTVPGLIKGASGFVDDRFGLIGLAARVGLGFGGGALAGIVAGRLLAPKVGGSVYNQYVHDWQQKQALATALLQGNGRQPG